ncbi:unnamed protein product [Aphanomyces euteiches]|uniref:Uncharacterized protein n=1 Tax=Aphanomyces euteiches TaxID=100861 RepID=A0A6G0WM63_9STRA|nr:hypothetical protein Ae201684_013793 [Aphanomyces euteiches]KAH9080988.1 hypothetical protein Ae201684P_008074 [Aphanomyces euteiches]
MNHSKELAKLLKSGNGAVVLPLEDYSTDIMLDELCGIDDNTPVKNLADLQSVFNAAIDKLQAHREVISAKMVEIDKQTRKASMKFQDSLKEPEKMLHLISAEMDELEDRFTKVSSSAVVIGDRLAAIDKEKNRVRETDELHEAILLLNTANPPKTTNKLYLTLRDPNQLHQAFAIVKKLGEFADELTSNSTKQAVTEIARLNQSIETGLLDGFSNAQERELRGAANSQDIETMAQCAASLVAHGCKDKVADRYVWNIINEKLTKNTLHDDMEDPAQAMDFLLTKIRAICKSQFAIIQRIFAPATCPSIRENLLERMLHDPAFGVLSHLEKRLRPDDDHKTYVATLSWTYEKTCGLVHAIGALPLENQLETERMQAFLTLQLQVLFGAHRQRYVEIEQALLSEGFEKTLAMIKWPPIPSGKNKYKLKDQAANKDAKTTPSSTPVTSPKADTTPPSSTATSAKPEPPNLFYQTLLAISMDDTMPLKFCKELKESTARCDLVLQKSELRVDLIAKLFGLYCQAFGDDYLGKMTNLAHELVQEPLLCLDSACNFFNVLKSLMGHVQLLDAQYKAVVEPYLSSAPTQQTICMESKRKTLEQLEGFIAYGLQRTFQAVEKSLVALLTNGQDKSDFMGNHMIQSQSKACSQVVQFLAAMFAAACEALDGVNRVQFVTNLSSTFKDTYIGHLQKFKFDADGACLLLTDLAAYRRVFQVCRDDKIDANFDLLHAIANIYALPRDSLVSYVSEGLQATLGKATLHALIRRRWDYNTNGEKIPI